MKLEQIHSNLELEGSYLIEAVFLDVGPDLLRNLRARHLLPTADGRQPGLLFGSCTTPMERGRGRVLGNQRIYLFFRLSLPEYLIVAPMFVVTFWTCL